MEAKITAINNYLGKVEGEDITLAVYWLVSTLASRLASARMMLLKQKLGHFPDTGEMMADLDEDEMGALEQWVSGRTYTATRVRGFAPWSPHRKTRALIERVQDILARYSEQLPLTNRQIFYILVGSEQGYPKTEQAYDGLCEHLNRARRSGMIPFSAIRDDGTQSTGAAGWGSPAQWWRAIKRYAENYQHDLTDGQPYHVELWVEAGGMVPQAAAVAGDFGIVTYSAGGFNGLTDKYETAQRLAGQERPSIVLHCGDYDPSGLSILDSMAEDVGALALGLNPDADIEFRRIVITPEQIGQYALPTAPQKPADKRGEHMAETVQAEALPPDVLAAEIREAIEDVVDDDALSEARDLGDTERTEISAVLDGLAE